MYKQLRAEDHKRHYASFISGEISTSAIGSAKPASVVALHRALSRLGRE